MKLYDNKQAVVLVFWFEVLIVAGSLMLAAFSAYLLRTRGNALPLTDAEFERLAVQNARDGLVVQDLNGIILWVNDAYCGIMGRDRCEMIGINPLYFALPPENRPTDEEIQNFRYDDTNPILKRFDHGGMHLAENQRKNGERFWMQMTVSRASGQTGEDYIVLVCRDVTDQVQKEADLRKAHASLEKVARVDPLTGIANRRGLAEFYATLKTNDGQAASLGLLHIDLDRFKEINDLNGHAAGDMVLKHISKTAQASLRKTDFVARLGGDEFVALCPNVENKDDLANIASNLLSAVSAPITWNGTKIQTTASIGAALADRQNDDLDTLLNRADFALYSVKSSGRGAVQVFDQKSRDAYRDRSRMTRELSMAIRDGKLTHHFQPVLRMGTGEIRKFEALTRWNHPSMGLLEASKFLDKAEAMGRMAEIDILAARAAAKMLFDIAAEGHQAMRVGINVSGAFMRSIGAVEKLMQIMDEFHVDPFRFVLEIPEQELADIESGDPIFDALAKLKQLGFLIVIDDFRAGSFGLTELPKLPICGLKISRAITNDLENSPVQRKVLGTVLEIARDLDLQTIIPGIETAERAKIVASLRADRVQGHWFGKPMPAGDVLRWIDDHYAKTGMSTDIAPHREHRYLGKNSDL